MIAVSVNGEARQLEAVTTVEALVESMACGRRGVAVAINAEVVPRSTWGDRTFAPGDRVEVLRAAQGG